MTLISNLYLDLPRVGVASDPSKLAERCVSHVSTCEWSSGRMLRRLAPKLTATRSHIQKY